VRPGALKGIIPIAVLLGLWQLLGSTRSPTLPAPSAWWQALERLRHQGQLWTALQTTVLLFVAGLALAIVAGVVIGAALGSSRRLTRALSPLLEFLRTTPAPAIVPGVMLLFGVNYRSDIGVIVFGAMWPVLLNTAGARGALPESRLDIARTLNLSWPARMRKIVLPSLLPAILTGVRVAAPICLIMTLLADFLLTSGGLGQLLVQLQQQFDAPGTFALLAVIGLIGLLLNFAIAAVERLLLRRWPHGQGT
jgi:ABC-type nitrate/sulfonate/bicarbonate transport system permease component